MPDDTAKTSQGGSTKTPNMDGNIMKMLESIVKKQDEMNKKIHQMEKKMDDKSGILYIKQ